ncbi:hypothetical protein PTSG_06609 [Salpingoeca rosetta]|uniref:SAM-dependent MTase RsmB/NOP-type domain-containing protein n=1 Tax=Salpingoeca rosetta (strain ATCC 50818 / BSB-021) TaxID=946362 RepID=F2UFH1_SALR5|nr:uncharacterized protein PTSG_06609 [Salpingoeca rosetta]EGD75539.1 hypothetical protein PTSG_06609 [Salpingoeca rosetta]|eukprot:XP_004991996.1 hypothetical protein PTSG_06609 [Salpingoeca rosetta]
MSDNDTDTRAEQTQPAQPQSSLQMKPEALPAAFRAFLRDNDIDEDAYTAAFEHLDLRYIRLSKRVQLKEEELGAEFPGIRPVPWCPGFYAMPHTAKLASSALYTNGHVYGMDVSSGAAVTALQIQPGDHCLDLCCAPGAKLCMMSDLSGEEGSVTGVDVSRERLAACRTLLLKYKHDNVRLYLADGRSFSTSAPAPPQPCSCHCRLDVNGSDGDRHGSDDATRDRAQQQQEQQEQQQQQHEQPLQQHGHPRPGRRKIPKRDRMHFVNGMFYCARPLLERYRLDRPAQAVGGGCTCHTHSRLYDKVMVDAECTHDGSIKHIIKYNEWGWDTFERRFFDPHRIETLEALQRQLLTTGFSLLRPGGRLVYSTCSFAKRQNESIISWFLDATPTARLLPADLPSSTPHTHPREQRLKHCIKFNPKVSGTSGLFVAVITKTEASRQQADVATD